MIASSISAVSSSLFPTAWWRVIVPAPSSAATRRIVTASSPSSPAIRSAASAIRSREIRWSPGVLWSVAILAIAAPLCIARFRRRTTG